MRQFIVVLSIIFVANCACGESVTVNIGGTIDRVDDPYGVLGTVGTSFTGSYTYESTQSPLGSDPDIATYDYNTLPNGMVVYIDDLVFTTDSSDPSLRIQISNDRVLSDTYLVSSNNNIFSADSGIYIEGISMQLTDYGMTALDGINLTAQAPDLSRWPSRKLYIIGSNDKYHPTAYFGIEGTIEFAEKSEVIPEPLSLVLVGLSFISAILKKFVK